MNEGILLPIVNRAYEGISETQKRRYDDEETVDSLIIVPTKDLERQRSLATVAGATLFAWGEAGVDWNDLSRQRVNVGETQGVLRGTRKAWWVFMHLSGALALPHGSQRLKGVNGVFSLQTYPIYQQAADELGLAMEAVALPGAIYTTPSGSRYRLEEDQIALEFAGYNLSAFWRRVDELKAAS